MRATPAPRARPASSRAASPTRTTTTTRGCSWTRCARSTPSAAHPIAAGRPVVVTGASQGGALSIAAAHLADGVAATMLRRPVPVALPAGGGDHATDRELIRLLLGAQRPRRRGVRDAVVHRRGQPRRHASVPALFSVGLIDEVTPSTRTGVRRRPEAADGQARLPAPISGQAVRRRSRGSDRDAASDARGRSAARLRVVRPVSIGDRTGLRGRGGRRDRMDREEVVRAIEEDRGSEP